MSSHTTCIAMLAAAVLAATVTNADVTTRDFTFESATRTHAARLVLPSEENRNGASILLLGGGNVQDMHWTVPGAIETPEGRFQFTIDGTSTTDADTLANVFADAGFIVMQWSSIYEGDPLHEQNRAMATPMEYPASVKLAADALAAMRAQPEINGTRIILFGHSLGATRACQITDDDIDGLVLLGGAYIARIGARPSDINVATLARWQEIDTDRDKLISKAEFDARPAIEGTPVVHASFTILDADNNGELTGWELGAAEILGLIESVTTIELPGQVDFREDIPWAIDVLVEQRDMPVLAIYPSLDPTSVHGPVLAKVAHLMGLNNLTIEYAPGLGHQFSIMEDNKVAPIEPRVVERVVQWLSENFAPQTDDESN